MRGHEFLNPPLGELDSYFASGTADLAPGGNLAGSSVRILDSWWARQRTINAPLS